MRNAFSLIELLVVIGVISILVGLALPAVQQIRENARSTHCRNNLRQISLGSLAYESTHRYLPGSWFNASMDSPEYHRDRGLFVTLLPFIDQGSFFDQMNAATTTFSLANNDLLSTPPDLLQCPSADPPAKLFGIAGLFSGPTVAQLSSATCDYVGNGGYKTNEPVRFRATEGPIGIQISGRSDAAKISVARVSDGLSNTLLFWESLGGKSIKKGIELDVDANAPVVTSLKLAENLSFINEGQAANKSYWLSWAGMRIGSLQDHAGKIINISNSLGQPYSRHVGGCNMSRLDGSVQFVSETVETEVLFALASAAARESNTERD